MKTPRVTDFDPDAKTPTLKSSLDNMPAIEKPKAPLPVPARAQSSPAVLSRHEQPVSRKAVDPKPPRQQSAKRPFVRRTFDFYEDQITYLTRESLQERLAGKERSMNEMVREAIDDWIKKRTEG